MSAAVSLSERPSIATRMARQDAPTVRAPRPPRLPTLPEISPERAAIALRHLETERAVRVYSEGELIGELTAEPGEQDPRGYAVSWVSEQQHDMCDARDTYGALWPATYIAVMGGRADVYRLTGPSNGRLMEKGAAWCPACKKVGHAWCGGGR